MTDEPLIRWDWVARNAPDLIVRAGEHVVMTLIAVVTGFVLSFALALLVRRRRRLRGAVLALGNVAYAIPSLALFALLIPWTGLSLLTAEIALVSYTILILVRDILAGLSGVPPDVLEAAAGMGGGEMALQRIGSVSIRLADSDHDLGVYWFTDYAGGIFIPFRDATNGVETYGGGRYLWDSAKGADLGSTDDQLVLDFNYAYHPSCVYDAQWSCPLAPPDNRLRIPIRGGERLRRDP